MTASSNLGRRNELAEPEGQGSGPGFREFMRSFACPPREVPDGSHGQEGAGEAGGAEALASGQLDVIDEYAAAVLERLLARRTAAATDLSVSMVQFLGAGLAAGLPRGSGWAVDLGVLRNSLSASADQQPAVEVALAQHALHLNGLELLGTWSAGFGAPVRLKLDRWVLPSAIGIEVTSTAECVGVRLKRGTGDADLEYRRSSGELLGEARSDAVELGRASLGEWSLQLLTPGFESHWNAPEIADPPVEEQIEVASEQVVAGMALLESHASRWVPWVRRTAREIRILNGAEGVMRSGSDVDYPGLLGISFPSSPVQVAEMLVHECSHQHYHIAERLGAVTNGLDSELYYSPVKDCGRPIEAILLAYHAFANVLLFYRNCIELGVDDGGYCQQNIERHGPELATLEAPLRKTRGLSEVGQAIWEPLAEELQ